MTAVPPLGCWLRFPPLTLFPSVFQSLKKPKQKCRNIMNNLVLICTLMILQSPHFYRTVHHIIIEFLNWCSRKALILILMMKKRTECLARRLNEQLNCVVVFEEILLDTKLTLRSWLHICQLGLKFPHTIMNLHQLLLKIQLWRKEVHRT